MSFLPHFGKNFYPFLNVGQFKRADTFRKALTYLEERNNPPYTIIETGTTRNFGNWSDGQSTQIWNNFVQHYGFGSQVVSIDINLKYIEAVKTKLPKVSCFCGDSVKTLNLLDGYVAIADLIYLDSFDLDRANPMPSAIHHLKELTAIYGRMQKGSLLMVDDCISDKIGKHILVKEFMENIGKEPFFTGYQWGWII